MAKRNKSIKIPVSDEELKTIRTLANDNNLSMATYLRNLALQDKKKEGKQTFNINDLNSIRIGGKELHRGDNLKVIKDYGFYGEESYITVDFKNGNWCLKDNENVLLAKYLENQQADEEVSFFIIKRQNNE